MRARRIRELLVAMVTVVASGSLLAGCTIPTPEGLPSASNPATTSPTSTPVVPSAMVMTLDGLAIVNSDGTDGESVAFGDGPSVVAFLTSYLGPAKEITPVDHWGYEGHDWGTVALTIYTYDNSSYVAFRASAINGLELRTAGGITVGSGRDAVMAASPVDTGYDADGDGDTDEFGIEPRPVPGTDSLQHPGEVGIDYVDLYLVDDEVFRIHAPAGDWRDL